VFGSAYQPAVYEYRPWLVKLDAAGNTMWSSENGLTQQVAVDSAIIRGFERADGSLVLVGGSNTFTNVQRPWVATASPMGTLQTFVVYSSLAIGYAEGTYIEDIALLRRLDRADQQRRHHSGQSRAGRLGVDYSDAAAGGRSRLPCRGQRQRWRRRRRHRHGRHHASCRKLGK